MGRVRGFFNVDCWCEAILAVESNKGPVWVCNVVHVEERVFGERQLLVCLLFVIIERLGPIYRLGLEFSLAKNGKHRIQEPARNEKSTLLDRALVFGNAPPQYSC